MKPSERLIARLIVEGVLSTSALSLRGEPAGGIAIYRDDDGAIVARSSYGVIDLLNAPTIVTAIGADGVIALDTATD